MCSGHSLKVSGGLQGVTESTGSYKGLQEVAKGYFGLFWVMEG